MTVTRTDYKEHREADHPGYRYCDRCVHLFIPKMVVQIYRKADAGR